MVREFKFLSDNKDMRIVMLPPLVDITINRAIITNSMETFHIFRNEKLDFNPNAQYIYGLNSFSVDNVRYHFVRTITDFIGRRFDNYIRLHDAMLVPQIQELISTMESMDVPEMF